MKFRSAKHTVSRGTWSINVKIKYLPSLYLLDFDPSGLQISSSLKYKIIWSGFSQYAANNFNTTEHNPNNSILKPKYELNKKIE